MKFGIVGTGCMGSVYAALLARAGHEVWAIDVRPEHLQAIERHGLVVRGPSGPSVVRSLRVASTPQEAGPCDTWILATKAHDVPAAARSIAPLLRRDDVVMAFQNGIGAGERVACELPGHHVVLGIAEGFGASIPEPGVVHHAGMRLIRIGEPSGGPSPRLAQLESVWRGAGFAIRSFPDVHQMIWEKFLCNVALSGPCAAFDLCVGDLMANAEGWGVALGCMREAHRAGVASGITFSFPDPERYVTDFASTIRVASPSMRLDHLARRTSEIDVINGAVAPICERFGLEAPYNRTITAILRERESRFPRANG